MKKIRMSISMHYHVHLCNSYHSDVNISAKAIIFSKILNYILNEYNRIILKVERLRPRVIKSCLAYLYGSGALDDIGEFCRNSANGLSLKGENAVLVNDEIVWKIAGEKISENLKYHLLKECTVAQLISVGLLNRW